MQLKSASPTKHSMQVPSFGFVGLMASGKNSYADELKLQIESELGIRVFRGSYSTKMIEVAKDLFGVDEKDRVLLGKIAGSMASIDPHVWTNYLIRQIELYGKQFIIDGIRFQVEEHRFRVRFEDFLVVRVEADEAKRIEAYRREYGRYPTKSDLHGRGEKELLHVKHDLLIFNEYNEQDRAAKVSAIVESIRDGSINGLLRR